MLSHLNVFRCFLLFLLKDNKISFGVEQNSARFSLDLNFYLNSITIFFRSLLLLYVAVVMLPKVACEYLVFFCFFVKVIYDKWGRFISNPFHFISQKNI